MIKHNIFFCLQKDRDFDEWEQLVLAHIDSHFEKLQDKSPYYVMLTGGNSAARLYSAWKTLECKSKKPNINFYFGDERSVPADHPESNYKLAMDTLFPTGIADNINIYRIEGDNKDLESAADQYTAILPDNIDLLLLSMGEDGHIASLFPCSDSLSSSKRVTVVRDAPKPPSTRITITPAVIRSAKEVIVMAIGKKKGELLAQALINPSDVTRLPIRLTIGRTWVFDESSYEAFTENLTTSLHNTKILHL